MFMSRFQNETYAAFRIVFGLLFLLHGSQKLFGFPAESSNVPTIAMVAGVIELVAGGMIAAGFMAGWAAFLSSGTMAAAYWMAHGLKDLFPSNNGGELAVLYCFAFLFIAARGSGIWSVDGARGSA
jgi:putative oxidoreductase